MKIRNGFVSNSSSSSFIVKWRSKNIDSDDFGTDDHIIKSVCYMMSDDGLSMPWFMGDFDETKELIKKIQEKMDKDRDWHLSNLKKILAKGKAQETPEEIQEEVDLGIEKRYLPYYELITEVVYDTRVAPKENCNARGCTCRDPVYETSFFTSMKNFCLDYGRNAEQFMFMLIHAANTTDNYEIINIAAHDD